MKDGRTLPVNGKQYRDYEAYYNGKIVKEMGKNLKRKRLHEIDEDATAQLVANDGRWLVKCPHCGGAEPYFPDGQFMCLSCFNEDNGFYEVKAPKNIKTIEAELEKRPIKNQHWEGETVKKLKADNKKHLGV